MILGSQNIEGIKLGNTNVPKAYHGADLIFDPEGYDIIFAGGQSNSYHGEIEPGDTVPDPVLDASDPDIFQIGRFDGFNNQVILAEEPLDHIGYLGVRPDSDTVGWALTFAKMYKAQNHLHGNRKILIVPVGEGGSGFADGKWNKGDQNYDDAVARLNVALAAGTGTNKIVAMLWHQGEDDSNASASAAHNAALLQMIDDFRTDLSIPTVPFVAGGLMPSWIDSETPTNYREVVDTNLRNIVTNRDYTGFADPRVPTELVIRPGGNTNHFTVTGHRGSSQDFDDPDTLGLAGRYWNAYLSAKTNI